MRLPAARRLPAISQALVLLALAALATIVGGCYAVKDYPDQLRATGDAAKNGRSNVRLPRGSSEGPVHNPLTLGLSKASSTWACGMVVAGSAAYPRVSSR